MDDYFTCKHCWNFHARTNAETGTCRATKKAIKRGKNEICCFPACFTPEKIEIRYRVVHKKGGILGNIKTRKEAQALCTSSNRNQRKELIALIENERKEHAND